MKALWLAEVLRDAGLAVEEVPGWEDRGRGPFNALKGVICHHTGSNPKGGNAAALATVKNGRPEDNLPGPLSQLLLARDGTFYVVAAGRSNHAGVGNWQGVTSGNSNFIGIEAENDGKGEPWPQTQMFAYERGVAAILAKIGVDAVMACGHKEYALPKGRKPDPTFDMVHFREDVEALMAGKAVFLDAQPRAVDPTYSMLRKGDMGPSVKKLQKLLGLKVDGNFGPQTEAAVMKYQASKHLVADGRVGPKTWAALGVK